MPKITLIFCALALVSWGMTRAEAQLTSEPGPGMLKCGDVVLVDDGKCPKGKIKQVTGGCNISGTGGAGGGTKIAGAGRQRKCVPRK